MSAKQIQPAEFRHAVAWAIQVGLATRPAIEVSADDVWRIKQRLRRGWPADKAGEPAFARLKPGMSEAERRERKNAARREARREA